MGIVVDYPAVSPSEWGAQVDYDAKSWTPWNPDKFVLHWGGTPVTDAAANGFEGGERAQLRAWENYHKNTLGWLGIAYNWAIGNSGVLYRLRGNNRSGATSGDYEPDGIPENHEALAVVFIVGEGQQVTPAAFATFRKFYAAVPQLELVIGHRDASDTGTTCPGPQVYQWIQDGGYQGGNVYGLPADASAPDENIRFLQRLLNDAHSAGLTVDGAWGPATAAAVAAVLGDGSDGTTINALQAKNLEKSFVVAWVPEVLHGNDSHSTDYAAKDHTHGGAGHNHPVLTDAIETLESDVSLLQGHTHDEGTTGPPQ